MRKAFITCLLTCCCAAVFSQSLSINTTGATADPTAMLDITSNSKGLLIPRLLTSERTSIALPATGLIVYDRDLNQFYYYNGSAWTAIPAGANANNYWTLSGINLYNNAGSLVGIGVSAPGANLDVTGTNAGTHSLQLRSGNTSAGSTSNQVLFSYNNTSTFRHAIKSRHNSGAQPGNAIDFYVWNQGTDAAGTIGTKHVMSLDGNGNVGVGITTPSSLLHVSGGNMVVSGTYGSGNAIEVTGVGSRMFFNPRKAAFRAGYVSGNQWDDANVGNFSVGIGLNASAKTDYSISIGDQNIAETSPFAVAIGRQNRSTGFAAMAMGHFTQVSGDYASAIGLRDTVSGAAATAFGGYNKVSGTYGFAGGELNTVSAGTHGFAMGYLNSVTASSAAAIGSQNTVSGTAGFAAGNTNSALASYAMAMGSGSQAKTAYSVAIGDANIAETQAFAVAIGRQNRSAGFASLAMGHFSEATGDYSVSIGLRDTVASFGGSALGGYNKVNSGAFYGFAAGESNTVTAGNGFAAGFSNTVSSYASFALGMQNTATGYNTFVTGRSNYTNGNHSAAFGFTDSSSADQAFTAGMFNTVAGTSSAAFGTYNYAPSYGEFTIGNFATQYTPVSSTAVNSADRVFTIGNGTAPGSRSDAMVVLKNGFVGIGNISPTSTLSVNGSVSAAVALIASSLTLNETHYCVVYTGGAGSTITLPAANSCTGRMYVIINHGTSTLTMSQVRISSGGLSTQVLTGNSAQIISDGTEWRRIN